MKLLTEAEAAEIMRADRSRVRRLRFSGALPYLPGRPVLIDEADLHAYLMAAKTIATKQTAEVARLKPPSEDAKTWALKNASKPKRKRRADSP